MHPVESFAGRESTPAARVFGLLKHLTQYCPPAAHPAAEAVVFEILPERVERWTFRPELDCRFERGDTPEARLRIHCDVDLLPQLLFERDGVQSVRPQLTCEGDESLLTPMVASLVTSPEAQGAHEAGA